MKFSNFLLVFAFILSSIILNISCALNGKTEMTNDGNNGENLIQEAAPKSNYLPGKLK